jgi:hypothetical protein
LEGAGPVKEVDLSVFIAGYRPDGQGRAAYHPATVLALLLYCYSKGIRSSRGIEAACIDDVGCRIITANHEVDHATIARFLCRHRPAVKAHFHPLGTCVERPQAGPIGYGVAPRSPGHTRGIPWRLPCTSRYSTRELANQLELGWDTTPGAQVAAWLAPT